MGFKPSHLFIILHIFLVSEIPRNPSSLEKLEIGFLLLIYIYINI